MIRIKNFKDNLDNYNNYEIINTTSTSKDIFKQLSPFFLGPCNLYRSYVSRTMENAWQYSKVYQKFTDKEGNPTSGYFQWATSGWARLTANRYPMGKGAKPLYAFWDGQKLNYIEARKQIYIPLYSELVEKTQAFALLKEKLKQNINLILLDFDGYDHDNLKMSLEDVINDPSKTMGHAFIIKKLLHKYNRTLDL